MGSAFPSEKARKALAKVRGLGKELDLVVDGGWTPRGTLLLELVEKWWHGDAVRVRGDHRKIFSRRPHRKSDLPLCYATGSLVTHFGERDLQSWLQELKMFGFESPDGFLVDAFGRMWEGLTLKKGKDWASRQLFESIEEFTLLLIEQLAGEFPLWLAPEQVRVLPAGKDVAALVDELERAGIRVGVDGRDEKLSSRVRESQMLKIPFIAVIGENEEEGQVSVRSYKEAKPRRIAIKTFKEELRVESQSR